MPDPYALTITVAIAWACLAALRARRGEAPGATDAVVWLLLWIPFDLRWFNHMWPGETNDLSYGLWSAFVTVMAIWGWGLLRRWQGLGRALPRPKDLAITLVAVLAMLLLVVPPGLGVGFITWNPQLPAPLEGTLHFLLIALTVALPEELYFRGVLQSMLEERTKKPWLAVGVASALFGLMHWNNVHTLEEQLAYFGLAAVAGVIYGLAYRRAKSLWPAVLCHTTVDWVWETMLKA
jgi:membrane protease YdiL (CAAX protease family)